MNILIQKEGIYVHICYINLILKCVLCSVECGAKLEWTLRLIRNFLITFFDSEGKVDIHYSF